MTPRPNRAPDSCNTATWVGGARWMDTQPSCLQWPAPYEQAVCAGTYGHVDGPGRVACTRSLHLHAPFPLSSPAAPPPPPPSFPYSPVSVCVIAVLAVASIHPSPTGDLVETIHMIFLYSGAPCHSVPSFSPLAPLRRGHSSTPQHLKEKPPRTLPTARPKCSSCPPSLLHHPPKVLRTAPSSFSSFSSSVSS